VALVLARGVMQPAHTARGLCGERAAAPGLSNPRTCAHLRITPIFLVLGEGHGAQSLPREHRPLAGEVHDRAGSAPIEERCCALGPVAVGINVGDPYGAA
jgi:hypothetical protein